ncbi:hypothetical protein GC197_10035 [bacterium]|nr:hypothetical protein [bacterium]
MKSTTKLTVYHGTSLVSPDPSRKVLRDVAECEYRSFKTNDKGQIKDFRERYKLHDRNLDGRLVIPTGLVSKLTERLALQGIAVEIDDRREYPKQQVMPLAVPQSCDPIDSLRLHAIRGNPLGQIEVEDSSETYDWIALILRVFPKAKVLIAVPTKRKAWRLQQELQGRVPKASIQIKKTGWPAKPPHCLIANSAFLASCPNEKFDIVLLPTTSVVSHSTWLSGMHGFIKAPYRLYGFVERGTTFSKYEEIVWESVSGPVIHQRRAPAAEVLWLPAPHWNVTDHDRRTQEWKHAVYCKNDRRNEFIAGVGNAFARQDIKKLRKLGVPFYGEVPNVPAWGTHKIVMLAESTEHAKELLKWLPSWRLQSHAQEPGKVDGEMRAVGMIMTTTFAATMGIEADVVIQAAGGLGIGQFQRSIAEVPPLDEETIPALIVEFTDEHDDLTKQDAESRARMYRKFGWNQTKQQGRT